MSILLTIVAFLKLSFLFSISFLWVLRYKLSTLPLAAVRSKPQKRILVQKKPFPHCGVTVFSRTV